jgi:hypothetical protein
MSEHDLATLLRDYVGLDEPPPPLTVPAMQRGRRIRRRRRWLAGAGTLGLVAVVGSVSMLLTGDPDQTRTTAVDPSSSRALADYDVHRMPELMDEHTRTVLARTADPGPVTFAAYDSQLNQLPERLWDKASQLKVRYGDREHSWDVSILHSRGEAEGDPEKVCSRDTEIGIDLSCTVQRPDDGDVVVTTVTAVRPEQLDGAPEMWMVVKRDELAVADLDQLWFNRTVKVIKSDTLITYVTEHLKATSVDPADAPFTTPVDDLVAIGTDPVMVMPPPPPGANGCPAWSLHQERISCSG